VVQPRDEISNSCELHAAYDSEMKKLNIRDAVVVMKTEFHMFRFAYPPFRKMTAIGMALTGLAMVPQAWAAGSVSGAKVVASQSEASAYFVYVDQAPASAPTCATMTNAVRQFAVDATTSAGKARIATILFAHATGRSVDIAGTGECGVWGDTESIEWIKAY
jgi:hypothetical protein